MERKCPKCETWNKENDYCVSCNHLLNYEMQLKIEHQKREEDRESIPKDNLDNFFDWVSTTKILPIRIVFMILRSVWMIMVAIVSFFMFAVATAPG